jgi:hypothetical protein
MGKMGNAHSILVGKLDSKRPLRRPMHRWEYIKGILGKYSGKVWMGCIWLRIVTSGRPSEHRNEPLGSMKGGIS